MILTDLQKLRVSVARIAQALGVDGMHLKVQGLSYEQLCDLAETADRGWNDLAYACSAHAQSLKGVQS